MSTVANSLDSTVNQFMRMQQQRRNREAADEQNTIDNKRRDDQNAAVNKQNDRQLDISEAVERRDDEEYQLDKEQAAAAKRATDMFKLASTEGITVPGNPTELSYDSIIKKIESGDPQATNIALDLINSSGTMGDGVAAKGFTFVNGGIAVDVSSENSEDGKGVITSPANGEDATTVFLTNKQLMEGMQTAWQADIVTKTEEFDPVFFRDLTYSAETGAASQNAQGRLAAGKKVQQGLRKLQESGADTDTIRAWWAATSSGIDLGADAEEHIQGMVDELGEQAKSGDAWGGTKKDPLGMESNGNSGIEESLKPSASVSAEGPALDKGATKLNKDETDILQARQNIARIKNPAARKAARKRHDAQVDKRSAALVTGRKNIENIKDPATKERLLQKFDDKHGTNSPGAVARDLEPAMQKLMNQRPGHVNDKIMSGETGVTPADITKMRAFLQKTVSSFEDVAKLAKKDQIAAKIVLASSAKDQATKRKIMDQIDNMTAGREPGDSADAAARRGNGKALKALTGATPKGTPPGKHVVPAKTIDTMWQSVNRGEQDENGVPVYTYEGIVNVEMPSLMRRFKLLDPENPADQQELKELGAIMGSSMSQAMSYIAEHGEADLVDEITSWWNDSPLDSVTATDFNLQRVTAVYKGGKVIAYNYNNESGETAGKTIEASEVVKTLGAEFEGMMRDTVEAHARMSAKKQN